MAGVRSHIARIEIDGEAVALDASHQPERTLEQDVSSYELRRAQLIADEKSRRFDHHKKSTGLSDEEEKAAAVVSALRAEERKAIWNREGDLEAFKGMEWQGATSRGARKGRLYDLLRKMPKGGLLHCHMDGTVDAKWLIENSFSEASADIWLTSTKPLTTIESLYEAKTRFRHLPSKPDNEHDEGQERITAGHTLYTSAYRPNTWVPLADVRAAFPHPDVYDPVPANLDAAELPSTGKTPSEKAFDHYIHSLMTLTPVPARFATPIKTSKQAWTKFTDTFGVIDGLFGYEPMLKRYFVESFKTLASDGVSYVEARVNFWIRQYSTSDGRLDLAHPSWVRIFQEALAEVKSEPGLEFWDAKIIYSTIRFMPNEELRWHVDNALALKQQFPDTIVGFDLVGWEDVGVTLHAYLPELLRMKRRCRELAIDLPFVLHAGETLADGDAIDDNLYDAILLGTKRIGHGYSLIKHPLLVDMVKSRQICVESCPISNEILRYTANTSVHPVLSLLARNVPVAISNDDPCQFGNPGLTPDFYQLISASDNLTLSSLGVLAKGSIDHFLVSEGEKERCRKKWEQQWSTFLAGVLAQQS